MGLYDCFEPVPPIRCLKCKKGEVHGWQDKHSRNALFLWRQGSASPVDQPVDDDCKISERERAARRLPSDEGLSIYGGTCDHCGAFFPYHLPLKFSGDTWTGFAESDRSRFAEEIASQWLQCPACLDAFELPEGHFMTACLHCDLLLMKSSPQES